MRKITHLSKTAIKLLPACVLAVMAMPAHSVWIDQPGVKNGLQFQVYSSIYPRISTTSSKFHYTAGDPAIFGPTGSMADVLANQDRKDSDDRYRLAGMSTMWTQFSANQALNKDWRAYANVFLQYNPNTSRNFGATWGLNFQYKRDLSLALGQGYNAIGINQTNADDLLSLNGNTFIALGYEGIPNLNLKAYHTLAQSSDVRNPRAWGWHKSSGVAAEYEFNFAPRNVLKVGAGTTWGEANKIQYYADTESKAKAYAGTIGYQYGDFDIALDYNKKEASYSGYWWSDVEADSYGVKAGYQITPRLKTTLSYAHLKTDNSKPVDLAFLVSEGNVNEENVFSRVKKDTYGIEATYNVWRGLSLIGSVENVKTRNYATDGEFSRRDSLTATAGARFTF